MQKFLTGALITAALILILAFGYAFYGQFALDYSLENLRQALAFTREADLSKLDSLAQQTALETLVLDEVTRPDADLGSVVLLDHARRALRDAIEQSGYVRAGAYMAEVLREKSSRRNWFLRVTDSMYSFSQSFGRFLRELWNYLARRVKRGPAEVALPGAGSLILAEAERAEREKRDEEALRYYREFLDRYPGRPERGFVSIALANTLLKMREFDEATQLLGKVRSEYPGGREEAVATALLSRVGSAKRNMAEIPRLEEWIREQPERIFMEKGGLRLALGYMATFQNDRAQAVLKKLESAPDPRIRSKALFYQGLLYKWGGDFTKGREIFEKLGQSQGEEEMAIAAQGALADLYYENKEYQRAVEGYAELASKAQTESWRALSELERSDIQLFRLGNSDAAKKALEEIQDLFPKTSPEFQLAKDRLSQALQKNTREDAFRALSEGRVTEAETILKKQLETFPRDGQSRAAYALILLLKGFLKESLENAEKAYADLQEEFTATVLGYVYENIGEIDKAGQYYAIGVQFKETYAVARYNLGVVHLIKKRFQEAFDVLKGVENFSPSPPSVIRAKVFNNRGCALWFLGRKEEARALFLEAYRVLPTLREAEENIKLARGGKPPVRALAERPVSSR